MNVLLELWIEFLLLACIAFGGASSLLPELHRVVVNQHHWMNDATFSQLFAIAQAAPGPNVLVVTLIGWQVAGVIGAIVATVAICLPMSIAIFFLMRLWDRFRDTPAQRAIQAGVAPLAVGLVISSSGLIGRAAALDARGWLLAMLVIVTTTQTRCHPLWLIAAGAGCGWLGWV
jgi:chromate transporter